jgi:hypothetical protein
MSRLRVAGIEATSPRLRVAGIEAAGTVPSTARFRIAGIEAVGPSKRWVRMPGGSWQPTTKVRSALGVPITPPDPVPGTLTAWTTRPVGSDYVTIESLIQAGDVASTSTEPDGRTCWHFAAGKFQALVNRLPDGKTMTFPTGVFEVNEPDWHISSGYVPGAVRWPKTSPGAIGYCPPGTHWGDANPLRTTIRVKTATAPAVNVAGSWFQVGFSGSVAQHWANLHFEGTDQGTQTAGNTGTNSGPGNNGYDRRIYTNFLAWNVAAGSTFRDILSTGAYGNNGAPPGESFLFQVYGGGSQVITDITMCRVCGDGRRSTTDTHCYPAAGITYGNAVGCVMTDCHVRHVSRAGFVWFQTALCETYDCDSGIRTSAADNVYHDELNSSGVQTDVATHGDWWNHERTTGTIHTRPGFGCFPKGTTDVHCSHSGDSYVVTDSSSGSSWPTANGSLTIADPTYISPIFGDGLWTCMSWGPTYGSNPATTTTPPVFTRNGAAAKYRWNQYGTWYVRNG